MKPGRFVQLLNSTPLGQVIDDRRLRSFRAEAGRRVGDGKSVDLIRFAAWLAARRHLPNVGLDAPPAKLDCGQSTTDGNANVRDVRSGGHDSYSRKKERERARNAESSRSGRDIGTVPIVSDPERKARARESLVYFGKAYFPERYPLKSSPDQLKLREKLQEAIEQGGLNAFALPRGSGKTTDCEIATLWATMTGRRLFAVLLGASQEASDESLESIKAELESNDLLAEDWPEVCYPIQRLEGINNRCKGQLCNGRRTQITWSGRSIVLPTIEGSTASGAIIRMTGLIGRVRGMKFTRSDGQTVRPDLVFGDDVQTDESAVSPSQTRKRLKIITGAVLGLAGPGKKIAAMFALTCIERDDLSDQLLDHKRHPEFHGFRCKLVNAWPESDAAKKHWDQYAEVRRRELAAGGDGREATKYVKKHFDVMHAGADIAWPERFNSDEISALQNAYNLKIDHPLTFDAEYQNDPPRSNEDALAIVPPAAVLQSRLNRIDRFVVPLVCDRLTAFIDVQQDVLYYAVTAWSEGFTGSVIDYGAWPDQRRNYYKLSDLNKTLRQNSPGSNIDGAILGGLHALCHKILSAGYLREDGVQLRITKLLIDAGYKSDLVYRACREGAISAVAIPSFGRAIGPTQKPITAYDRKPGEQIGMNWLITRSAKRAARHVLFDSNWFKSFLFDRFAAVPGDPGSLSLFGTDPHRHHMLGEHLTAEYPEQIESKTHGRTTTVWALRPGRDNHWLDCIVGTTVAASITGSKLLELGDIGVPTRTRKKFTAADMPRRRSR